MIYSKTVKRLFSLVLAFLVACSWACSGQPEKREKGEKAEESIPVRFGKVQRGELSKTLELVGNLTPGKKAVLMPNVPGTIEELYRDEGDVVSEGEPIIEIDSEDVDVGLQRARAGLASAQATAAQARVQLNLSRKQFRRVKELREQGSISRSDYDQAGAAYEAAREAVKMADAGVENSKALLEKAQTYKGDTIIKAPFEGAIAKLMVDVGDRVYTMPPTAMVVVIDYDTVKIECPVAERDVGSVEKGKKAEVALDAYPNTSFEAKIEQVAPYLEPESRTFTVKLKLDNPDHKYKPGMMARVYVDTTFEDIIYVHRDAFSLSNITGKIRVVEVVDGVAKERPAVKGRDFGKYVEIKELAGLEVGSLVITSGASDIVEGQPLELVAKKGSDVKLEPARESTMELAPATGEEKTEKSPPEEKDGGGK